MNTFLPYSDFDESARCLDRQRLGKQRVECVQLLRALHGVTSGWRNHPATRMWEGYDGALALYGVAVCNEWTRRGYRDRQRHEIESMFPLWFWATLVTDVRMPPWLGDEDFHRSHKSNLLRKDFLWYGQYNWPVPPNLPYVWPTASAAARQSTALAAPTAAESTPPTLVGLAAIPVMT